MVGFGAFSSRFRGWQKQEVFQRAVVPDGLLSTAMCSFLHTVQWHWWFLRLEDRPRRLFSGYPAFWFKQLRQEGVAILDQTCSPVAVRLQSFPAQKSHGANSHRTCQPYFSGSGMSSSNHWVQSQKYEELGNISNATRAKASATDFRAQGPWLRHSALVEVGLWQMLRSPNTQKWTNMVLWDGQQPSILSPTSGFPLDHNGRPQAWLDVPKVEKKRSFLWISLDHILSFQLNRQPIFLVLGGHGRRGDLPHLHLAPKCGMQPMWSISNLCNLQLTAYYIHILYIRYIYLYIIIYIYIYI